MNVCSQIKFKKQQLHYKFNCNRYMKIHTPSTCTKTVVFVCVYKILTDNMLVWIFTCVWISFNKTLKKGNPLRESVLVLLASVCKLQNGYLSISNTWVVLYQWVCWYKNDRRLGLWAVLSWLQRTLLLIVFDTIFIRTNLNNKSYSIWFSFGTQIKYAHYQRGNLNYINSIENVMCILKFKNV